MYSPQQPVDSIWPGNKCPGARPYPCVKERNDVFYTGIKRYFKTRYFIPAGYYFSYLLFIFLLLSFSSVQAQDESEYSVHANIIYHFTKYIDWPANKKTGQFIIGVAGDTPLFDALKKNVTNKMVGDQEIVIKKIKSSATAFGCHILFISDDESNNMKKIVSRTAGNPVLLVSESDGLAQKGGCINFVMVSDHLKLEINKNNIEQRNLSIASELLQLGKVVK